MAKAYTFSPGSILHSVYRYLPDSCFFGLNAVDLSLNNCQCMDSLACNYNPSSVISNNCDYENANNSLKGAYRDVVKYLKYFFGKPKKVLRPPSGDLIDTQS